MFQEHGGCYTKSCATGFLDIPTVVEYQGGWMATKRYFVIFRAANYAGGTTFNICHVIRVVYPDFPTIGF
jgi:hypothetical protein